ncbi:MAG: hypothetical protein J7525_09825 [Roseofilum sp. SID3]|nr:hypothetical protein [Roseofilum sp. SID2]MBP0013399.1 hypothetical protein [Roseofilum sp. SID3]
MRIFYSELNRFNDNLRSSMNDLQKNHDRVSPLWQDDMRKEYDRQWQEFDEMMKNYLQREAPAYSQFLDQKLQDLARYLGHR